MSHAPSAVVKVDYPDQASRYAAVATELSGLLSGERDWLVNLANTSALLNLRLPELNWVGFYLWRGGELVLGPFQGNPACMRIARGRGVCGCAAARRCSIVVPDVSLFPGHIACDSASASELVVPLALPCRQLGVLDLDSPRTERFDDADRIGLEEIARILVTGTDWPSEIGDNSPSLEMS